VIKQNITANKQGVNAMRQTATAASEQESARIKQCGTNNSVVCNTNRIANKNSDRNFIRKANHSYAKNNPANKDKQSYSFLPLSFLLLLFIFPSALFAEGTPIYVWGFGETIADVFRAVSSAVSDRGAALTAVALSVGSIIVVFKFAGMQGKPITPFDLAKYPAIVILLQQLFLSTNGSPQYMVIDETTNTPYSVGKLPLGIGESFSIFSNMQRSILAALDQHYSTPNSIGFRNAGLGFGMSIHDSIAIARPLNQAVMMSFNAYMEDCLVNESYSNPLFKIKITNSSNLLEDMKVESNFITTYYSTTDGTPSVEYCPNAWSKMASDMTKESRQFLKQLANSMGYNASSGSTEFSGKVGKIANHYFSMSESAEQYITQSMLANMNDTGIKTMSALSGINLSAMAWMPAYTERRAQSAFLSAGFMAKKYMPIMQMTLISIVICISWILALLTIATHNVQYIRLFLTLILTISLWMIIASIMNFSFDLQLEKAIKSITYNVASGSYQIGYKNALDSTIGDRLAMLGYISWLIPILAFAIAKASDVAFAGMFGALGQAFGGAANIGAGAGSDRGSPGGFSIADKNGITHVGSNSGATTLFDGRMEQHRAFNGESGIGDIRSWTDQNGHAMQTITTQSGASWTQDMVTGKVTVANLTNFNANVVDQQVSRETNEYNKAVTNQKTAQENWTNTAQSTISDQVSNALASKEGLQTTFVEADKNGYGDQYRIAFARTTLKHWDTISQHIVGEENRQEIKENLNLAVKGDVSAAASVSSDNRVLDAVNKTGKVMSPGDSTSGHGSRLQTSGGIGASAEAGVTVSNSDARYRSDNYSNSTGDRGSHQTAFMHDYSVSIAHELSLSKQHMAAYEESLAKTHSEAASKLNSHSTAYSTAESEARSHSEKISAMRTMGDSFSSSSLAAAMNIAREGGISNDQFMGTLIGHISSGNYEAATSYVSSFGGSDAYGRALGQTNEGAAGLTGAKNNTNPNYANANTSADVSGKYKNDSGSVGDKYYVDDRVKLGEKQIGETAENSRGEQGYGAQPK
jgi:conjugal transfer mating pair stabilization protein TraG